MRALGIAAVLVGLAFGFGISGVPGAAVSAAADWAAGSGHLHLKGPVGDAVREAL